METQFCHMTHFLTPYRCAGLKFQRVTSDFIKKVSNDHVLMGIINIATS